MIDIHSHIIFGLDDGAQTLEDTLFLAKQAVKEGISVIIGTPHHRHPYYNNPKNIVEKNIEIVQEMLKKEQVPLTILPGQEIRIFGELKHFLNLDDELLTLNKSKMILIEFPSLFIPLYTEKLFYDLQVNGYNPVIAHPERNAEIIKNPDKLFHLIKNGAFSQITTASIAGYYGKKTQRLSFQMIEYQLTHFIASDVHNLLNRSFKWKEAWDTVDNILGEEFAGILQKQAQDLIGNREVHKLQPEQIPRKIFNIF